MDQPLEMTPLSLATTAWACVKSRYLDAGLLRTTREVLLTHQELDDGVGGMAVWALSQLEDVDLALTFVESAACAKLSSLSMGPLISLCERQALRHTELRVWGHLVPAGSGSAGLGALVAWARILRLLDAGQEEEAATLMAQSPVLTNPKALAADVLRFPHGDPHEKELRLAAHVLTTATAGDPASVCKAMEDFGLTVLAPSGQWLKIAGGEKATVLRDALQQAPSCSDGSCWVLEVGTYCGYSSLQMASSRPGSQIITIEAEPARVVIARCLIAFAGCSEHISVRTGHSQDLLPLLGKDCEAFGMVFLDQRGARFGTDLHELEKRGLLLPKAVVVADNVLKPGAPAYLWHVIHGGSYATSLAGVEEFAMPGTEDWMSVSIYEPQDIAAGAEMPPEIRHLEWEADLMRSRAQSLGPGHGVSFAEWAAFAARMRRCFEQLGLGIEPPERSPI